MPITAWAVTTGEVGMRTQARGLALAVADTVIEKTVAGRFAWPWPAGRRDRLEPPWPDLMITCGRRSTRSSIAVRKASGGRTLTVHVQDPRQRADAFDLVIAMEHDEIAAGGNVIKVATALHDLTAENLAEAGAAWAERFAPLGRPLAGVMIGGETSRHAFALNHGRELVAALKWLREEAGAALAVTLSRRTPADVAALVRHTFRGDPRVFIWDGAGENPYRAILALSDRLLVTSDSVSMVSEALASSHPVEVFDLGFPHYGAFVDRLIARGLVRRFTPTKAPPPAGGPVNATTRAADAVRALIQRRTGTVG